jgi:O-methyltransferase
MNDNTQLYLELIKKCLTDTIYKRKGVFEVPLPKLLHFLNIKFFKGYKFSINQSTKYKASDRETGKDWPVYAHTMIGIKRIENIQFLIEDILKNNIPGDLIEAGVWRGGAVIFMRAMLKAYDITNRIVWVADSFEGLPAPDSQKYPQDKEISLNRITFLNVSLEEVKNNFKVYGLLDEQVRFLKGWFKDTLPKANIKKLSLIRADGDMYESTMDILINLYPKLSKGGYVIIDDYESLTQCKLAVSDFRKLNHIKDKMIPIDGLSVYWKKT